ncbi:hypothetical protein PVAP13_9NG041900 [Panicum virgatum]|uniref:Uncharacterized protein n=1 Tax=Panicum virgatum TaxID=38727 RepID=A0A8T0MFV4_PANVG|nr:hypothetical protein PVAP13_9NG041900 [Panicum virgatum]
MASLAGCTPPAHSPPPSAPLPVSPRTPVSPGPPPPCSPRSREPAPPPSPPAPELEQPLLFSAGATVPLLLRRRVAASAEPRVKPDAPLRRAGLRRGEGGREDGRGGAAAAATGAAQVVAGAEGERGRSAAVECGGAVREGKGDGGRRLARSRSSLEPPSRHCRRPRRGRKEAEEEGRQIRPRRSSRRAPGSDGARHPPPRRAVRLLSMLPPTRCAQ